VFREKPSGAHHVHERRDGSPKGVCSATPISSIRSGRSRNGRESTETTRELTTLSLSHLFGLAHTHIYWTLAERCSSKRAFRIFPGSWRSCPRADHQLPGTPGGFKMILDRFPEQFARHGRGLKYIIVNSAPMAREYIEKMLDFFRTRDSTCTTD